eukprot:632383-Hanusia_phi.AAC.1
MERRKKTGGGGGGGRRRRRRRHLCAPGEEEDSESGGGRGRERNSARGFGPFSATCDALRVDRERLRALLTSGGKLSE